MKVFLLRSLCAVCILSAFSCGQWKVSTLKGKKLCTISGVGKPGGVTIDYGESGVLNLSFIIKVYGGKIYTADNIQKRVQVLDIDGTPQLVIGQRQAKQADKDVRYAVFNFGTVGSIAADSHENIYLQNRLAPGGNTPRGVQGEEVDFSPSYVLVFDKNGNLQRTLGQRGTPDIPFYYIETLFIDKRDRLFVVSRSLDTWSIIRFTGKNRDFYTSLGNSDFKEKDGEDSFTGRIENVGVFASGEGFLVSVAYYHGSRFKYRKIFEYSLAKGGMGESVIDIPDPKNELFSLVDDKHIYLWNMETRDVRFVIVNFEGRVVNNVLIELRNNKQFEDVFMDEMGQLYSLHVGKRDIEIMEWK